VLALAVLAGPACGVPAPPPSGRPAFDLEEATIADLQARMTAGRDSARSLVEKYLARIEAVDRDDRGGPALGSVIAVNPDALAAADSLDDERRRQGPRGPLHGIPLLIKDNIATLDRMPTTAGSLALASVHATRDAFIVERLRAAGAIVLGKANLSEWANFRSTHSVSGWSAVGGQTRNPYALDRTPCGSSSGSAVATAANLAAAAIGTETDGSIVCPASYASLVGVKPTLGLLSRSGLVPIASSQDTPGPLARTVADAAVLLGAMVGADPDDPATSDSLQRGATDYSVFLDPGGLRGARIGVVRRRLFGHSAAADRLAEAAIADLRRQGAVVVDPADIPTLGRFEEAEFDVLLYEFKVELNQYLARIGPDAPVRSLTDLIAFNEAHRHEELRYFDQDIFTAADRGGLAPARYRAELARIRELTRAQGIDAVMDAHALDALVAPTFGPAWLVDFVNGDVVPAGAASPASVAAVAGYPHVTVPMGDYRGLPMGLSFIGRAWSEPTLLRLAYAFEQATKHRRPPTFAPSADLEMESPAAAP
jgi:amidase